MTGSQALVQAVARLRAAGVPDAPRDARRLLAHALGVASDRLTLVAPDELTPEALAAFQSTVTRRTTREPVSHIIGLRSFYGRDFHVSPDVLDPRPETETLIAQALLQPFDRLLDLGTGSGCIVLTLLAEHPGASGLGTDLSEAALQVARANSDRLQIAARFAHSDWFEAVSGTYDLIVSNPPYIAADEMPDLSPELSFEPEMALTDAQDGLSAYRIIAAQAPAHLAPGGRLMVEIGPTQASAVQQLFKSAGLVNIQVHPDLDGRDRVVSAVSPFI